MLQVLLKGVMDGHAETADIHEQSLQLMSQRAASEVDIMVGTVAAAVAATMALQNQIVSNKSGDESVRLLNNSYRRFPACKLPIWNRSRITWSRLVVRNVYWIYIHSLTSCTRACNDL